MKEGWVLNIRDQCRAARVPFFFKQWGGTRKKKAGRELQGKIYGEMPAQVHLPVASRADRELWIEQFIPQ